MKNNTILVLLTTVLFCCSKKSDLTPVSPMIGEWKINRIVYSGFPPPFNSYNRVDSTVKGIGTDIYKFTQDYTYSETYTGDNPFLSDSLKIETKTETGTWIPYNTETGVWSSTDTLRKITFEVNPRGQQLYNYVGMLTPNNELKVFYSRSFRPNKYDELVFYSATCYYTRKN